MTFELSATSKQRLSTVHADMQKLINAVVAVAPFQIVVMQALRTAQEEMQIWLSCHNIDGTRNGQPWKTNCNGYPPGTVAPNGVAGTGVSNHQSGHAVDIAAEIDGAMAWDKYQEVADLMLATAAKLQIPIVWGGTFSTPDNDHFELNKNFYT
jgi:peptidoglycan L-alanyl-D-glutamate endopeptidase CwlK